MNARMNDPPSPFARAVGTAAAGLVVALIVLAFTYLLRMLDFGPLQELIAAEDQVYDAFRSPEIRLLPNAHRVVFIDIDDNATRKMEHEAERGFAVSRFAATAAKQYPARPDC